MLFSATQTKKIEDLAKISLKADVKYIGVDDHRDVATVEGLEQVCVCVRVLILAFTKGICGSATGTAIFAALYIPQEELKEKSYCLPVIVQFSQISC